MEEGRGTGPAQPSGGEVTHSRSGGEREGSRTATMRIPRRRGPPDRSEEHTSELQSLMRISYAVFCLKKKNISTKAPSTRKQGIISTKTDRSGSGSQRVA